MNSSNKPGLLILEKNPDDSGSRVTGIDKILVTVIIGIVFFILALPFVFKLSNYGTSIVGVKTVNSHGTPTLLGVFIHAIIFIIIVRLLMQ